jgi:hypothetical protein
MGLQPTMWLTLFDSSLLGGLELLVKLLTLEGLDVRVSTDEFLQVRGGKSDGRYDSSAGNIPG